MSQSAREQWSDQTLAHPCWQGNRSLCAYSQRMKGKRTLDGRLTRRLQGCIGPLPRGWGEDRLDQGYTLSGALPYLFCPILLYSIDTRHGSHTVAMHVASEPNHSPTQTVTSWQGSVAAQIGMTVQSRLQSSLRPTRCMQRKLTGLLHAAGTSND